MKGTFDNGTYEFVIEASCTYPDVYFFSTEVSYDGCDGLPTERLFTEELCANKLRLMAYPKTRVEAFPTFSSDKLDLMKNYPDAYEDCELPEIELVELEKDDPLVKGTSIDYAFAYKICKAYQQSDADVKKASLAFLERYIADYAQVRNFAQTGVFKELENMDPMMGISYQGTANPKTRR